MQRLREGGRIPCLLEKVDTLTEGGAGELAIGALAQAHDVLLLLLDGLPQRRLVLPGPQHADLQNQRSPSLPPLSLHSQDPA